MLRDLGAEFRMGVDAGADRRAAGRQFQQCGKRQPCSPQRQLQLADKSADLLAEPQRRGVCQVRAANLDDGVPLRGLVRQRRPQPLQGRQQFGFDRQGRSHVDRGGEHVVGRLSHVYVVVRMDRLLFGQPVAASHFDGPVGNDLVGIHVRRRAGAGLVDVDGKLIVEFPGGHFAGGGDDRLGKVGFELAEIAVGQGRGCLDQPQGPDQARAATAARKWGSSPRPVVFGPHSRPWPAP